MAAAPCQYTQVLNQHQSGYIKKSDVLGYLQQKFPEVNARDFEIENVSYRWRFKTPVELQQEEIDGWVNKLREVARQNDNTQDGEGEEGGGGGGGSW